MSAEGNGVFAGSSYLSLRAVCSTIDCCLRRGQLYAHFGVARCGSIGLLVLRAAVFGAAVARAQRLYGLTFRGEPAPTRGSQKSPELPPRAIGLQFLL